MSFSGDIKRELLQTRPKGPRAKQAQAYGLFAFARAYSPDEISLRTESAEIAARYADSLKRYAPKNALIAEKLLRQGGKELRQIRLEPEACRRALLARMIASDQIFADFRNTEELSAFLAGAYLACGNASDPEKGYHLEFAVREQPLAESLLELLGNTVGGAKMTRRRGICIVYYKEVVPIEDLLTLMGASKASLAMVEVEIVKDVRNRAMRVTNCETANIDKTVKAAASQIEDIELIRRSRGLETLPEPLREAAVMRLSYPELSLRELAYAFEPPLSRSGLHHRLDKLREIAREIRHPEEKTDA